LKSGGAVRDRHGRGVGQLSVALDLRALAAGGGAAVHPVGGVDGGAHLAHLIAREHLGDVQHHGGSSSMKKPRREAGAQA
jgi:hypothetical protein